jgi:hypothetical protein
MYYLFTRCRLKFDYMFRPFSLGHNPFISLYLGNYKIYDTICGIKSLFFNEISFLKKTWHVVQQDFVFHENVTCFSTRSSFSRKRDVLFNEISFFTKTWRVVQRDLVFYENVTCCSTRSRFSRKRYVLFNEISFFTKKTRSRWTTMV